MSLNSRQAKANALLNTTNNTRVTVISSSKRNPYASSSEKPSHATNAGASKPAAAAVKQSASIKTGISYNSTVAAKAGAFIKRNARDTGKDYVPQTQTDKLLMGLLDDKPKKEKPTNQQTKQKLVLSQQQRGASTILTGDVGAKRPIDYMNTAAKRAKLDDVFGMPPPARSYPAENHRTKINHKEMMCDVLVAPPPARTYPQDKLAINKSQMSAASRVHNRATATKPGSMMKREGSSTVSKSSGQLMNMQHVQNHVSSLDKSLPKLIAATATAPTSLVKQATKQLHNTKSIDLDDESIQIETQVVAKPLSLGIGRQNRTKSVRQSTHVSTLKSTNKSSSTKSVTNTPSAELKSASINAASVTTTNSLAEPTSKAPFELQNTSSSHVLETETSFDILPEPIKPTKHAEWYNPEEHAAMKAQVSDNLRIEQEIKKPSSTSSSGAGVNDNFVRLDLRNSSGSCRGARNLKKVNKQKAWRAKYRFGKSDGPEEGNGDGNVYGGNRKWIKNTQNENETKCFASARNGGVDPLDDFIDGVFSDIKSNKREGVVCTRHSRPCKLITVKRNNKGNKGKKFYVCSMPVGEKCDFFKWEEDTMEATQRALLQSSSSSGFIARQVAASKARFKELTVPELRTEAKKRGLDATGKKDQLITRLLIWTRDEIADSVEPDCKENTEDAINDETEQDAMKENDDSSNDKSSGSLDIVAVPNTTAAPTASEMIELSDDSCDNSDEESEDDEFGSDELEICHSAAPIPTKKAPRKDKDEELTLHESLEQYFGYTDFREGQEWAIRRCLSGTRTLLVAPTGQGKSLCYALPAALMDGICLVVSPLISLMQDQLRQLPPKIPAATLSGSISAAQMALIIDDVLRGRYKVLFVSPERLASASFRRLIRPKFNVETRQYERQFPPVSLLCVDEAHCLSQWGHNFRPSYLRVKSLLPLIEPKSVMALTATAGPMVVRDICNTLCIPLVEEPSTRILYDASGVKVLNCNRDNIDVYTMLLQSNDERQYLLQKILKRAKDEKCERTAKKLPIEAGCLSKGNVIIYVWRQKDTEIVAEQLIGAGVSGGIVCYHGGMEYNDRAKAQNKFLRGKARICVATVAFGLGINKPDIDGVIHLCLPPSPEHYLQEIGRAGRDGREAKAIALPLVDEMVSRHSLAHSDRIARSQLAVIFSKLRQLVNDALGDIPEDAGVDLNSDEIFVDGMHVALPVFQIVPTSDCKEECIETIMSLLEEDSSINPSLLSVEGYLPDTATITLKRRSLEKLKGVEQIAHCIEKCGARVDDVGTHTDQGGTAMDSGFHAYSFGTYQFSVTQCARIMGPELEPRHVFAALRRLQGKGELELNLASNGRAIHIRMKQAGINLFRTKKLSPDNDGVDLIVNEFSSQFIEKERVSVGKVESMFDIIRKVSACDDNAEEDDGELENEFGQVIKSKRLVKFQELVQNYFSSAESKEAGSMQSEAIRDFPSDKALLGCLSRDISSLLQLLRSNEQQVETGVSVTDMSCTDYRDLCVAKILHAIDAPRAPILTWYSHPLWGKYRSYSFSSVVDAVKSACSNF